MYSCNNHIKKNLKNSYVFETINNIISSTTYTGYYHPRLPTMYLYPQL